MTSDYLVAEKELLEQIHSRGHWRVVFRPQTFKQRVTPLKDLFSLVDKLRIDMAGWRFPFVPDHPGDLTNGQRHINKDWRDKSGWWPAQMTPGWKPNALIGISHITQMVLQVFDRQGSEVPDA